MPVVNDINAPLPERAPRMRSREELNAEYDDVMNQGKNFVLPGQGKSDHEVYYDPQRGGWVGEEVFRKEPGRWSYSNDPLEIYNASRQKYINYAHMPKEWRDKLTTPEDALAEDILRHAYNNENIPGFAEQGEALARKVRDLPGSQEAERDYNRRAQANYHKFMWPNYSSYRYYKDADRYGIPTDISEAMSEKMYGGDFRSILKHYGADFQNPASIEEAYKKFWRDEMDLRSRGQPNMHDRAYEKMRQHEDDYTRQVTGLDPKDPKNKAEIDRLMDIEEKRMMGELQNLKAGLDGTGPSQTERFIGRYIDPLLEKYAVPAATVAIPGGIHAGYNLVKDHGPSVDTVKKTVSDIKDWRQPTVWPYEPQHISTEDMLKHFYGDDSGKP